MPEWGVDGKSISSEEMKKNRRGENIDMIWRGTPYADIMNSLFNVMENPAMKCDRCGVRTCAAYAESAALAQNAGMIRHSGCGGGLFATQK